MSSYVCEVVRNSGEDAGKDGVRLNSCEDRGEGAGWVGDYGCARGPIRDTGHVVGAHSRPSNVYGGRDTVLNQLQSEGGDGKRHTKSCYQKRKM